MEANVGTIERIIRASISFLIILAYFKGIIKGLFGGLLLIIGGALLPSVMSGYCPLNELLGISTKK